MRVSSGRHRRNCVLSLVFCLAASASSPLFATDASAELSTAWRLLEEAAAVLTEDPMQARSKIDAAERIYGRLEHSSGAQGAKEARLAGEAGLWFLRARIEMDTAPDAAQSACDEALQRTSALGDTLGSFLVVALQADGESGRGRHEQAIRRLRQAERILLEHEEAELPTPLRSDLVLLLLIWDECPHRDWWRSLDQVMVFEGVVLRILRVATRQWLAEELYTTGQREAAIRLLESTLELVPANFPSMEEIRLRLAHWRAGIDDPVDSGREIDR